MTKQEIIARYGEEAYSKHLEKMRQYIKAHREELREYNAKRREENREEYNRYHREYQQTVYLDKHTEHNRYHNHQSFAYCIPEQIEQIENYEAAKKDNFYGWHIHHKLETESITPISRKELMALDLYYNRPAEELIFLTASEHRKLHMSKSSK